MNHSLAHFPPAAAHHLAAKLRHDWQAHYFEIVVGRYLQVLGADIEYEPLGSNGTHVDFRATFPDGVVSVECVSKRFNQEARETLHRNARLAGLIDQIGPIGWLLDIEFLPAMTPNEFQPLLDQVAEWFRGLPGPIEGGERPQLQLGRGDERLELTAIPRPTATKPMHIGPAVASFSDATERLKSALRNGRKRAQGRGARPPVFLAVDSPWDGPDAEDFDEVLFGRTVQHVDLDTRTTVGFSFDSGGLLVSDPEIPFAGVIAFLRMGLTEAGERGRTGRTRRSSRPRRRPGRRACPTVAAHRQSQR